MAPRRVKSREVTTVGLYELTRTSEPINIDLAKLKPGESLELRDRDEPLSRVNDWLSNIMWHIQQIRDSVQTDAVKAFAERCSVPATRLMIALRDVRDDSTHSGQFLAYVMEIAAELADEWQSLQVNAALELPVTKYRKISAAGARNIAKAQNEQRRAEADEKARGVFNNWRSSSRLPSVSDLSLQDQLNKFLSGHKTKPKRALRERLNRLIREGRLEK